jgi:hypothetical protein
VCQFQVTIAFKCRSRYPRGPRRGSAAARLLGLCVRIPSGAWMSVSCQCCVLSRRGLCDGLVTRPEESYRLWCVSECDCEASIMRRPWTTGGCCAMEKKTALRYAEAIIRVTSYKTVGTSRNLYNETFDENSVLLGYDAASTGNRIPVFRGDAFEM